MAKIICKNCGEQNNDINAYCLKCKTPFSLEEKKAARSEKKAVYDGYVLLRMPSLKVFLLGFLSLGIYGFFWFYRQWKEINKSLPEDKKIFPFFRALFCVIYIFPFSSILNGGEDSGADNLTDAAIVCVALAAGLSYLFKGTSSSIISFIVLYGAINVLLAFAVTFLQGKINKRENSAESKHTLLLDICPFILLAILIAATPLFLSRIGGSENSVDNEAVVIADDTSSWNMQTVSGGINIYTPFELLKDNRSENASLRTFRRNGINVKSIDNMSFSLRSGYGALKLSVKAEFVVFAEEMEDPEQYLIDDLSGYASVESEIIDIPEENKAGKVIYFKRKLLRGGGTIKKAFADKTRYWSVTIIYGNDENFAKIAEKIAASVSFGQES